MLGKGSSGKDGEESLLGHHKLSENVGRDG